MSNSIPTDIRKDYYKTDGQYVDLIAFVVTHEDESLYFVNDWDTLTYNSQVYEAAPFEATPPNEDDSNRATASLSISDVQGKIYPLVRQYNSLDFTLQLFAVSPTGVVTLTQEWTGLKLQKGSWNSSKSTFTLSRKNVGLNSFPKTKMNSTTLPNII